VLKLVEAYTKGKDPASITAICLGRKGYEFCLRKGFDIPFFSIQVRDEISIDDLREVSDHALRSYQTADIKTLAVFFQNFVTTFNQEPVRRQLLPLNSEAIVSMIKGIIPKSGRFSEQTIRSEGVNYVTEPSVEMVFNTLIPELTHILLYHALLETKASEHSARMVAMKNASDNAKEVSKVLTLKYNKARQAMITREVSEITGGMEAMKQK
jgi:F-type H+-transporting ATPase subunit gamma